jgi:hypothetical protein
MILIFVHTASEGRSSIAEITYLRPWIHKSLSNTSILYRSSLCCKYLRPISLTMLKYPLHLYPYSASINMHYKYVSLVAISIVPVISSFQTGVGRRDLTINSKGNTRMTCKIAYLICFVLYLINNPSLRQHGQYW